jgi:hypothetical protein
MKLPLIYLPLLVILIACNSHVVKNDRSGNHSKDSLQTSGANSKAVKSNADTEVSRHPIATSAGDTSIVQKKIPYDLYTFRNVILQEPFSADSALKKLFLGNYYKLWTSNTDSISFEAWSCKRCTKHTFFGWESDSAGDVFPFKDSNETRVADTVLIMDNGKRNIIVSFGTRICDGDFFRTGRFNSAFMGLALFTEENNKWVLKAFNPAIGYYGMFQTVPQIHPFKYSSGNVGCYIGECTGGSGGPYFTKAYVFSVSGNTFKIVLEREDVAREDTRRNTWDSKQQIDSSQLNKKFPDIIITTYGDYLKADFDSTYGDDTSSALALVKPLTKQMDNFDFTIKARYTFTGEKYKSLKETIVTSPHKVTEYEKNFRPSW